MTSKTSKSKRVKDEEMDTSDDDYIDPEMEKYFKKKEKPAAKNGHVNGTAKNGHKKEKEEIEDDEEEDVNDSEDEDDDDDDDDMQLDEMNLNEDDENQNEGGDDQNEGRIRLTLKIIQAWQAKLSVIRLLFPQSNYVF